MSRVVCPGDTGGRGGPLGWSRRETGRSHSHHDRRTTMTRVTTGGSTNRRLQRLVDMLVKGFSLRKTQMNQR